MGTPNSSRKPIAALAVAIGLVVALAGNAPAGAQASNDTAKEHYRKGNVAFDLRRYSEAAREYEAAFEQHDDPALLFDIAQAYRYSDDYGKAIASYRSYLRRVPRAKNRADVLALIADLQKLAADQRHSHESPPNQTEVAAGLQDGTVSPKPAPVVETPSLPPAVEPAPILADDGRARTERRAGIGLLAGGGALVVGGAVLVALAYTTQSSFNHPSIGKAYDPNAPGRITAEQVTGGVLLGVGVGALVTGAVLEVMGKRAPAHVALAPALGDHQLGVNLAGVWP